jgi:hypothetical protein
MTLGHIYFIQAGEPSQAIKIGWSAYMQVRARLNSMKANTHLPLEIIGAITGTPELEQKLQLACAPYRIRGEWFRECPEMRRIVDEALATGFETLLPDDIAALRSEYAWPIRGAMEDAALLRRANQDTVTPRKRVGQDAA